MVITTSGLVKCTFQLSSNTSATPQTLPSTGQRTHQNPDGIEASSVMHHPTWYSNKTLSMIAGSDLSVPRPVPKA